VIESEFDESTALGSRAGPAYLPIIEVVAFVAALSVSLPFSPLVPLVVVASVSLWWRGLSWADVGLREGTALASADLLGIGAVLGAATAVLDRALWGSGLEALTGGVTGLDITAPVRGQLGMLITALVVTWIGAIAAEMVFRGYLIARLEPFFDDQGRAGMTLLAAAAGYAWLLSDGHIGGVLGGFALGVGYGFLYLAGGRNLLLPIAFHGAFESVNLVLVYLRVV
jgi:hypothetical protein